MERHAKLSALLCNRRTVINMPFGTLKMEVQVLLVSRKMVLPIGTILLDAIWAKELLSKLHYECKPVELAVSNIQSYLH